MLSWTPDVSGLIHIFTNLSHVVVVFRCFVTLNLCCSLKFLTENKCLCHFPLKICSFSIHLFECRPLVLGHTCLVPPWLPTAYNCSGTLPLVSVRLTWWNSASARNPETLLRAGQRARATNCLRDYLRALEECLPLINDGMIAVP